MRVKFKKSGNDYQIIIDSAVVGYLTKDNNEWLFEVSDSSWPYDYLRRVVEKLKQLNEGELVHRIGGLIKLMSHGQTVNSLMPLMGLF